MNGETSERVLLCLSNGVWVEGSATFLTHDGLLNFVNDSACNFLPLTDVKLYKKQDVPPTEVDFLAVNIKDVTFMTVLAGSDDVVARDEIVALVTANGQKKKEPRQDAAVATVRWLDDEVVSRLNICRHLLSNGRTDDRSAGLKLVLDEIISEIQKRSRDITPSE
ncbi:MAG: hypothetical protein J7M12_04835 [Candidatus Hydrogenedentes bacterium]|nr:hypothetical protein [Candidatus Hydrogenedentota bacterium]